MHDPAALAFETLQVRECQNRVTMIDPNIRPMFITDQVSYHSRINRMITRADIVQLSNEDLHWLMGEGDLVTLGQAILANEPSVVLLTEGALGARAITKNHNRFCATPKAIVVDTVGAGDTFNAGFLAALDQAGCLRKADVANLSPADLDAALSLGTRVAAMAVARAGANPPWKHEL